MQNDLQTLKEMIDIIAISGREQDMTQYIVQCLRSLGTGLEIGTDKHNNVYAVVPGLSKEVVMLDAHLDQIGFVVSSITKEGMLVCYRVGGCSVAAVEAREFVVLTSKGNIPCVADRKHVHLIDEEKDELPKKTFNIVFDIGCKTKEEAEALVEIGDYIGYKPTFGQLQNNLVFGTALDDKIGCLLLLKILNKVMQNLIYGGQAPKNTLVFTFTGQEETGITRLKHLIKRFHPAKLLEFDVTFASDYDKVEDKEVGPCLLGEGLVVYVGNLSDVETKNKLVEITKNSNLKIQKQVLNGAGGYNSDAVYSLGEDTDVTIMGIPLRNMHSPVEVCSMNDIESGVELVSRLFY